MWTLIIKWVNDAADVRAIFPTHKDCVDVLDRYDDFSFVSICFTPFDNPQQF
jgi:hypothetical protein